MNSKDQNYYTAGELAEMFQIQKQTLLYYDKIGLLKPEYVSENNYRHYTIAQYMTLEIIISLRKLDIAIVDIKKYLNDPSETLLQELLLNKQKLLQEKIMQAQLTCDKISNILMKVAHASHQHSDGILLEHRHKQKILVTKLDHIKESKEMISLYARHNLYILENSASLEKGTGWIIKAKDYFDGYNCQSHTYYSLVDDSYQTDEIQELPSGTYLSVHFQGTFHNEGKAMMNRIKTFLENNQLEVISDIYCMPIKDHWLAASPQEYVSRISMQVEYKNSSVF